MKTRGQWQGMLTIAQFNWPYYAAGLVVWLVSLAGVFLFADPRLRLICGAAVLGSGFFVFGSLGVSHLVYDRSDLYRWEWLRRALGGVEMREAVFCHCGYEDALPGLMTRFGGTQWRILDHYDQQRMTEPSIHRARALFPPVAGTLSSRHDAWPVAAQTADVVFGLLAIHELRSETERTAWFGESRRCLRPGGRVVLVEHVRDAANFLAFGPAFLHFHSPAGWRRCWERAGLQVIEEFRVTPFVRIFVLSAS